jgi:hypothetical protein
MSCRILHYISKTYPVSALNVHAINEPLPMLARTRQVLSDAPYRVSDSHSIKRRLLFNVPYPDEVETKIKLKKRQCQIPLRDWAKVIEY